MIPKRQALYIGINTPGTTSKMRAEILRTLLSDWDFQIIDTDIPKRSANRLWQSIGFRYKRGPLIGRVNTYVKSQLSQSHYDLIWVDKAIYLTKETTKRLRSLTDCLVHFTPDPAFTFHQSPHFFRSLPMYDFAVTTKSYEMEAYGKALSPQKVLYATQGYDRNVHHPICQFTDKKGICFLGHYEEERAATLQRLLNEKVDVTLAGISWDKFVKKNRTNPHLIYLGKGVYGEDYVKTISGSLIAWGSVSKWIPEQHTTRTFEIPACGTALLTERNAELATFFNEDEAIFYDTEDEMIANVHHYLSNPTELEKISMGGMQRVQRDGRDYESIITKILTDIGII